MLETGRQQLGSNLKMLRAKAGKTGREIAASSGLSHAKVSRLENGRYLPTEADINAYAKACHANRTEVNELLKVVKSLQTQWADAYEVRKTQTAIQPQRTQALEENATQIDIFEGTAVPALLQTPKYCKGLARVLPGWSAVDESEFTTAKLHRQAYMQNPKRKYRVLMKEDGLRNPIVGPGAMAHQMDSLLEWLQYPNIEIAVVPHNAPMTSHLFVGFAVFDRSFLRIELYGRYSTYSDKPDIEPVLHAFDTVFSESLTGLAAVDIIKQIRNDFANAQIVDIRKTVNA